MSDATFTGGCQCGAVRFRAGDLRTTLICHCRMCQKAFGSYFGPLAHVGQLEWTRGAPAFFASSNRMKRGFCEKCGTPLMCIDDEGMIEVAGGAFDDPSIAPPTVEINTGSKLAFFATLTSLPRHGHADKEQAYNATIVSFQHPDHDTAVWPPREHHHG